MTGGQLTGFVLAAVVLGSCQDHIASAPSPPDSPDVAVLDAASRDGVVAYDPPSVRRGVTLTVATGTSRTMSLGEIVADPDTPLAQLVVTLTPSDHVEAETRGARLHLTADSGWEGTESIAVTVADPTGLQAEGAFDVVVGVAVIDDPQDPDTPDPELPVLPQDPAAARNCAVEVRYDRPAAVVAVASELNGWADDQDLLAADGAGGFSLTLTPAPGIYGYKLVVDGDWILDPTNPYLTEVDGTANSLLRVPSCATPLIETSEVETDYAAGTIQWTLDLLDTPALAGIDLDSLELTLNREPIDAGSVATSPSRVVVRVAALSRGRYSLRASVSDLDGSRSNLRVVPVWLEEQPFTWDDAVLYFAFTDRFRNGDPSNDDPPGDVAPIGSWLGGDFAGIQAAIEEGYFDALGVNALWISSPNDNPDEAVNGDTGNRVTAYHGYFPRRAREVENHFGDLDDLRSMVDAAHARGIRVMTDFVANHIYDDHPYYTGAGAGDFNALELCREIDWSKPITCWFEPYLPDFNYDRIENVERTVEDALWWVDQADLDGFRLDAVKHMNHNVGYRLRHALDDFHRGSGTPFYTVGETFTGTWSEESANDLAAYVSPAELHGQFNFPFYWEVTRTLARRESGYQDFSSIDSVLASSAARFPPPALMSLFIGNHDVSRFVSHANGDIADLWGNGSKDQGWNRPPDQPTAAAPYDRIGLALTLMMTLPGVPLIYYGDEIGLAGAGDPDNRRLYPWGDTLASAQQRVLARAQALGHLRQQRVELRRGERETLLVDGTSYVYIRALGDQVSVIGLNNGDSPTTVTVGVSRWLNDGHALADTFGAGDVAVDSGSLELTLDAWGGHVWSSSVGAE